MILKLRLSFHSGRPQALSNLKMYNSFSKMMLARFFPFFYEGIAYYEFTPPGQTMNSKYCCRVLQLLRKIVCHNMLALHRNTEYKFHHDNALAHELQLT